jgi:predicted O-linked N-acetylglucosamine transferase (SPINDLY family)
VCLRIIRPVRACEEPRIETPDPIERKLESATAHHRAGRLSEARRLYRELLAVRPRHPITLFRLGLLELQEGRAQEALSALSAAVDLAPGSGLFQFGRGQALSALARWPDAVQAYERALEAEPALVDAWAQLGIARQRSGQLTSAIAAYRRALSLDPGSPGVHGNLGAALGEAGELTEAIRLLERARALEPDVIAHAVNLGLALDRSGRHAEAAVLLEQVSRSAPDSVEAAFNLAQALRALDRTDEAVAAYQRAIALRPGFSQALTNLGNLHRERGELVQARAAYEAALRASGDDLVALNNLAVLLRSFGQLEEAQALLERALAPSRDHPVLQDTLGNVLKDAGLLQEALACFRRSLALDPQRASTHSNLAYSLSFCETDPQALLEECRRFQSRFAAAISARSRWDRDHDPERRLRIGYVSPDFREHCQALFMRPLLASHDHHAFEIVCYSSVVRADARTRELAALADRWHEVQRLDDAALAERIDADRIDVLVDLTMHMAGGRPLLFARKPAPVQIAWLAYPGTTGLNAMDYRLSDARLDPPGTALPYSERTLWLSDSFWCYDPLTAAPEVGPLPALERGRLTFGCLNNPCKLTDATLALWAPVLRALPETRLHLLAPRGRFRGSLSERFEALGVDARRLEFKDFRPRAQYLASYRDIDLGLDTFPYNGHTTSLDALWMGVPSVTRTGPTVVGRGGASQLHQLELGGLVAESDAAFIEIARDWAGDLERLAQLRATLRTRFARSSLMDGARFARGIERCYREAWRDHCARVEHHASPRAQPPPRH